MMTPQHTLAWLAILPFAAILWLTAEAFSAAHEHQTTYRFIADALATEPERQNLVTWDTPTRPLNRNFNTADEVLLGRALGEAWQVLAVAQATGNHAILHDRWTGPALERATVSVADAVRLGGRMAVVDQKARPVFYHKDGSLFQAEIELVVSRFMSGGDVPEGYSLTRETGIATLLNEANGWRLFSYERKTAEALENRSALWSGTANGINYYPSATPWHDFWPAFDPEIIAADFARIRDLGANAVRVFLPTEPFVAASSTEKALMDLQRLLQLAEAHDLQVIPTLFDLRTNYRTGEWAMDALYLDRVLPVLAASDAVAFLDLKNEPDLDFPAHGQAEVLAWLRTMLGLVRRDAPNLATTIGWSAPDHAALLAEAIDVITYHEYGPLSETAANLNEVRSEARGKPVVITEIGSSSYELALHIPGSDAGQSEVLADRFSALQGADGVFVWTLFDFPEVDPRVIGSSLWVRRLQTSFGVFRADGTEKPAAAIVRQYFRAAGH